MDLKQEFLELEKEGAPNNWPSNIRQFNISKGVLLCAMRGNEAIALAFVRN